MYTNLLFPQKINYGLMFFIYLKVFFDGENYLQFNNRKGSSMVDQIFNKVSAYRIIQKFEKYEN